MTEAVLVQLAEACGWRDGAECAPYHPPTAPGACPDADDAYRSAYFHGLAYVMAWRGDAEG